MQSNANNESISIVREENICSPIRTCVRCKIYQNGRVRGERGDGLGQQSITCRSLMSLQSSHGQHQHPSRFDWLENKSSQVPRNSVFGFGHWELVWSSTWTFWWFLVSCITQWATARVSHSQSEPQPEWATSRNKKISNKTFCGLRWHRLTDGNIFV